jgi:hypothetical protein
MIFEEFAVTVRNVDWEGLETPVFKRIPLIASVRLAYGKLQ